jgi:antitoxin component YwqK of YwqJK toxin-antitoxin module
MKFFYLFAFTIIVKVSFGQAEKAYITKDGKFGDNPKSAVSYVIIEKLAGDSAYSAVQYDMRDTIVFSGFYKDERLSIPNGKFIYYQKNQIQKKGGRIISNPRADTLNHVEMTGYIINGKRQGRWVQYASNGRIKAAYTFENDKANGPFINIYGGSSQYRAEGTMVDDMVEGKFLVYNVDSLLVEESNYVHDKMIDHIVHFHQAMEPESLQSFLEKKLVKYKEQLTSSEPVVKFTVDKDGKITDPQIVKGINTEIDKAVIAAFMSGPHYTPANYDLIPSEQKVVKQLFLFKFKFNDVLYRNVGFPNSNAAPVPVRMVYYLYNGTIVGAGMPHH